MVEGDENEHFVPTGSRHPLPFLLVQSGDGTRIRLWRAAAPPRDRERLPYADELHVQ